MVQVELGQVADAVEAGETPFGVPPEPVGMLCEERTAVVAMVGHEVGDNGHTATMRFPHQPVHCMPRPEMRVHTAIVRRVVAVISPTLLKRREQHARGSEAPDIVQLPDNARQRSALVPPPGKGGGTTGEAVYKNMIDHNGNRYAPAGSILEVSFPVALGTGNMTGLNCRLRMTNILKFI